MKILFWRWCVFDYLTQFLFKGDTGGSGFPGILGVFGPRVCSAPNIRKSSTIGVLNKNIHTQLLYSLLYDRFLVINPRVSLYERNLYKYVFFWDSGIVWTLQHLSLAKLSLTGWQLLHVSSTYVWFLCVESVPHSLWHIHQIILTLAYLLLSSDSYSVWHFQLNHLKLFQIAGFSPPSPQPLFEASQWNFLPTICSL